MLVFGVPIRIRTAFLMNEMLRRESHPDRIVGCECKSQKKALPVPAGLFIIYCAAVVSVAVAVVSTAVVSTTGAGSVATVSTFSAVSAGLDPQKVSVNAKTVHKTAAEAILIDFFIVTGLKFPFIHQTS
jgi:hypothetical protein